MFDKLVGDISNAAMYKLAWLAQGGIEKTANTGHMVRQLASAVKRNRRALMSLKDMPYSKLNMPEVTDIVKKVRDKLQNNKFKADVAAGNISRMGRTDPVNSHNVLTPSLDAIDARGQYLQRNLDAYNGRGTMNILSKYSNDPGMASAYLTDPDLFRPPYYDTVGDVLGSFF